MTTIPPRHSWFADATLPRLPAPYFWSWSDKDLNIVFNHDNTLYARLCLGEWE
jgi:hypothetical protein